MQVADDAVLGDRQIPLAGRFGGVTRRGAGGGRSGPTRAGRRTSTRAGAPSAPASFIGRQRSSHSPGWTARRSSPSTVTTPAPRSTLCASSSPIVGPSIPTSRTPRATSASAPLLTKWTKSSAKASLSQSRVGRAEQQARRVREADALERLTVEHTRHGGARRPPRGRRARRAATRRPPAAPSIKCTGASTCVPVGRRSRAASGCTTSPRPIALASSVRTVGSPG